MKKAVLILAALLLVGSFVFAQDAGIKIGAWGRGIYVPVLGHEELESILMTSWGPGGARVGVTISGSSPNVGFQLDFNGDLGSIGAGDQQKIWVKPIDMLTLQVGRIYDDTLRGNAGAFGAWNWLRFDFMVGEDAVFERLGINGQRNFALSLAPIEGLYLNAGIAGILTPLPSEDDPSTPLVDENVNSTPLLEDVLATIQAGIGYTIAGIGTARVQYVGENQDNGEVGVAFKLTAVQNLSLDVGAKIPVALSDLGVDTTLAEFALGAGYNLDALGLNAVAALALPSEDNPIEDPVMQFGLGASYSLGGGIGVEADVRWMNDPTETFEAGLFGVMAGVSMGFSNGLIGIGVEVTNSNFADWTNDFDLAKANIDDIVWAIPVRFEYWF